jgi:transposase
MRSTLQRKSFTAEFKAKVALEVFYDVHPNPVANWKREAQAGLVESFSSQRGHQAAPEVAERERLYSQIGRLQVELDGLKKSLG